MHKYFDQKHKKNIIIISPGEYYSTNEDEIIQTVLGSCISVCLYSESYFLTGMNHFMLPESVLSETVFHTSSGRYGMYAMELLIADFIKNDIPTSQICAKVFGGSNLLGERKNKDSIASSNIKFIIDFLNKEKIPIISSHLGGNKARKIMFYTRSKKVQMKEIVKSEQKIVIDEEIRYNKKIIEDTDKRDVIFFD
jgi:chemotaxis protein CheD